MPFTPYHLGPGLFFGVVFLSFLDLPTFLIASVIVDIEPFLVLYLHLSTPVHGFFHSFLGGTIIALILTGVMFFIRKYLTPVMAFFKLEQERSFLKILFASLLGIYIHILFDASMYWDIQPLFPLDVNPFLRVTSQPGDLERAVCGYFFIGGLVVYAVRIVISYWRKQLKKTNFSNNNKLKIESIFLLFN